MHFKLIPGMRDPLTSKVIQTRTIPSPITSRSSYDPSIPLCPAEWKCQQVKHRPSPPIQRWRAVVVRLQAVDMPDCFWGYGGGFRGRCAKRWGISRLIAISCCISAPCRQRQQAMGQECCFVHGGREQEAVATPASILSSASNDIRSRGLRTLALTRSILRFCS